MVELLYGNPKLKALLSNFVNFLSCAELTQQDKVKLRQIEDLTFCATNNSFSQLFFSLCTRKMADWETSEAHSDLTVKELVVMFAHF